MRRRSIIAIASLLFLIACNNTRKPSSENFTKAINQYLEKHGQVCTSIGRQFPIDIPTSVPQVQYGFGLQLATLQQAGLVSESDTTAAVHGMLDPLRGATTPQSVRRYQLTVEGRKYFQQILGTFGQTGGLCYGQKTVDSVLKWGDPAMMDGYSHIEVTYTYKIARLAPWAERPDVQRTFPDIGSTVSGISKTSQTVGLRLTDNGWEIPGS